MGVDLDGHHELAFVQCTDKSQPTIKAELMRITHEASNRFFVIERGMSPDTFVVNVNLVGLEARSCDREGHSIEDTENLPDLVEFRVRILDLGNSQWENQLMFHQKTS
jgi:hypothetical protein